MNLKFTAKTLPECEQFFFIKWPGEDFIPIDEYISLHANASDDDLDDCTVNYRGIIKNFRAFVDDYATRSENMKIVHLNTVMIIPDDSIRASFYFMKKACDCLSNARFFTMKSISLIESDSDMQWRYGYIPQFQFRCIYFGTASTWYSNTMDNLLQAVYWAFRLYEVAVDRDGNPYDKSWDAKKTMTACTYEFVVGELKNQGLSVVRKLITKCSGEIQQVRTWANYIKHKGGVDYLYLEADDPFQVYIMPESESASDSTGSQQNVFQMPDKRFAIENFKSPIQIDIDEKLPVLEEAHKSLYNCITAVIDEIDYESHKLF